MTFSRFDHECMATALRIAAKGLFTTDPNPRVGCVIASGNRILGQGWHVRAGEAHAEIVALHDADCPVRGATAYVTLEPCNHHGRTSPCTEALAEAGVSRVVIAAEDPNPDVRGGGIRRLKAAGIAVDVGLMELQADALNPGFMMRMKSGRPWVRVKTATSLDGRTALRNGESKWISSEASRRDVQRWRAQSSAILTGIGTVLADDPAMNARIGDDVLQPLRVVADSNWRTPVSSRILSSPGGCSWVAGSEETDIPRSLLERGVRCMPLPMTGGTIDLPALMEALAAMEINEVQVEAGARLCGSLLSSRLVDEILVYQAPLLLGEGGAGPFALGPLESMTERTHLTVLETAHFDEDLRIRLQPVSRHGTCLPE